VVVLDAGHGGNDSGARGRDGVLEKDLAAQLVSRVRLALLSTKKYRTVLTRVGDSSPTFEQRELAANVARPLAFLTFHAGNLGTGTRRVVVYSYQPPTPAAVAGQGQPQQLFVPWTQVQQAHLEESRQLALALQQQFKQIPGMTTDRPWQAPERSLRSVNAPAVAIEIGSLSPEADSGALTSPDFQQAISAAIVRALEALHKGES
jgi:N-acetylmuramoyl-L-alanine amidase